MSKQVDERVVSMQFDNAQFEQGVSTTMSTLDKLKQSLKLDGASKGLESVQETARRLDFSGISSGIESIKMKFSALEVMAVTTLGNITNSAVNAGKKMVSAFTIEPVKAGFSEYETQINAVQTILANTQSKGTTLDDVNDALDELNTYADKTIYNFTEMTRNIGTFTAAGVDLDTSVSAIKGIANLAAVSGSTSQQASTAMYQLSQALASGTVKLMDWNSVVNAGMGGQVFQDALKETARVHGIAIDSMIEGEGSFRETLKDGWLTSSILTETLSKFTGDLNAEQLKNVGYTEEQIEEILKLGQTANDAATKVKTFTQLMDTLKEAAQSGWTQTWEILVGDFEEAKKLWTSISDIISEMLNKSAKSRNDLLQGWKDKGGRTMLIDSLKNAFDGLMGAIEPVKEAFSEVFPSVTVKQLLGFTKGLKDFTSKLKISKEAANDLKTTFKGIFSIFDIARKILVSFSTSLFDLLKSDGAKKIRETLFDITSSIGKFFISINKDFDTKKLTNTFASIGRGISDGLGVISKAIGGFSNMITAIGEILSSAFGGIWKIVDKTVTWITENFSLGDIFTGVAAGGILSFVKEIGTFIDKINNSIDKIFGKDGSSSNIGTKIKDILSQVHDALAAFTINLKSRTILMLAVSIGILAKSIKDLSEMNFWEISQSVIAIAASLSILLGGFKKITKVLTKGFNTFGITKAGLSLILMAESVKILADAIVKLKDLNLEQIGHGIIGIGSSMLLLSLSLKILNNTNIPIKTSIALLALAESCKLMADALLNVSKLQWSEIGRGLTAMGGALVELGAVTIILGKLAGKSSISGAAAIFIISKSLDDIANALIKFGSMKWPEIGRGLSAMGGALVELGAVVTLIGRIAGFSAISGAVAIFIISKSLGDIANALIQFGSMEWSEIGRGLSAMGGALVELGAVVTLVGRIAGFSAILGGAAIFVITKSLDDIANALIKFGSMTWSEVWRGLTAMGLALVELGAVITLVGRIAGFSAILGGAAVWVVIQGLDDLANALKKFGSMKWPEIWRGLTAMGLALAEIGVVSGVLGRFTGLAGILGGAAIWVVIQGLDDLANALKKFGSMEWDEIGRGLTAMGVALAETAILGLLNSLSFLGAYSIDKIAGPLGNLADAVKKWKDVSIPDEMSKQLGELASGVYKFTFHGSGANALSTAAPAIGIMADSVKKWKNVSVPEGLNKQIGSLASGLTKFTLKGLGANVLETAAPAIGTMADSVKKWENVVISDTMGKDLASLADGIKAFSFAFVGGWSIGAVIDPLGKLAGAVQKWKDTTIPQTLTDDLSNLAKGVRAFSFAFVGGWSIGAVIDPLGKLAGAVQKWKDTTIPSNLGSDLKTLADGISKFNNLGDISPGINGLKNIGTAAEQISKVNFATVGNELSEFVETVGGLKTVDETFNTFSSSLSNSASKIATASAQLVNSFANGIKNSQKTVNSAGTTLVTNLSTSINSGSSQKDFMNSGTILATNFSDALENNFKNISGIVKKSLTTVVSDIKSYQQSFYYSGTYLVSGLVNGIKSKMSSVYDAAKALGREAVRGERDGQQSKSPSKLTFQSGIWFGEGLINGIKSMIGKVYKTSNDIGRNATDGLSSSISKISDMINADIDAQPTIKPVLDLSDVRSGAGVISTLLGNEQSIGVLSNVRTINTMMNRRQNGDTDVISAIKDLGSRITENMGNTYSINGVSYEEGSDVSDAIRTLVRAVKIDRRS